MNMNSRSTTGLIRSIYATVSQPEQWQQVLLELCANHSSQQAVLWRQDLVGDQFIAHFTHNVDEDFAIRYREHFHTVDVRAQALKNRTGASCYAGHTVFPEREYLQSEIYNDFSKPQDTRHTLEAALQPDLDHRIHLGLHRGHSAPSYSSESVASINRLLPHIMQSLQLADTLLRQSQENSGLQTAIDQMPDAVALCTADGHILTQNSAMSELTNSGSPARITRTGKLQFADTSNQLKFQSIVSDNLAPLEGKERQGEQSSMLITDKAHRYSLKIAPWIPTSPRFGEESQGSGFVVLLRKIKQRNAPIPRDISSTHPLSPAEAEVATLLCRRMRPDTIARQRGVATSTVRQQIKAIMRKLNCHTQAELVALLLTHS